MEENIQNYRFKISVVSAVYKAEMFLDEFFDSMINQTIGFENIQLIMVDDGSPDRSGEICDEYAERYPENIISVHKENGGPASARNEGLKYIEGRYVNFCDPDDTMSHVTVQNVYTFFENHENEVEIVAIPLYLFGARSGPHHLNTKFAKGTRVINLEKEYANPLLSSSTAFFKHELAKTLSFNPGLVTSEDAEQVVKKLIDHHYLGVVANARYNYRRYDTSLIATASTKKGWYLGYLTDFIHEVMDYAEKKYGYIPRFVQYTCMCDLQWKFKAADVPEILDAEELAEYRRLLDLAISRIDEEVIMEQRSLSIDIKAALIARKCGTNAFVYRDRYNVFYGRDFRNYHRFSNNSTELCFLKARGEGLELWARQTYLFIGTEPDKMYLTVNDAVIEPCSQSVMDHQISIGDVVSKQLISTFLIPYDILEDKSKITLHTKVADSDIIASNIRMGEYFPLTAKYKNAYARIGDLIFTRSGNSLIASRYAPELEGALKKKYCAELRASKELGAKKSVSVRRILEIFKKFKKKPIWIISDRINKAGDNGEAFFRYLKSISFKDADCYYAINSGEEYNKLKHLGNVIARDSWKYKILHLAADVIISSHADAFVLNPFSSYYAPYQDLLRNKHFVFLQHGITQNDISDWLNKFNKDISGFVCAAIPEQRSIIDTPAYFYTEREAWLTGFARFDRLYHDEKKQITIMPTWRKYLFGTFNKDTALWEVPDSFKESDYFIFYNSLINDGRLLAAAREYGYTVCYMPHPNIITRADLFDHHPEVRFFGIHDEYRTVYAESDLVLTDYSSAAFDFAYLRKPIVYAQFDKEKFFEGGHICKAGYFDYVENGFGEVTYGLDETVNLLIDYMKNGCALKEMYRERIDGFFAFNDKNNCQRILEKILELDK